MRRVLLTGSAGLLGQYLVALAEERGPSEERMQWLLLSRRPVWGEVRFSCSFLFDSFDLADAYLFDRLLRSFRPHVVIHAAALTDVDLCTLDPARANKQNVAIVTEMLSAMEMHIPDAFFIYLSTDFVFSGKHGPYGEDDVTDPINAYGQSKQCAERAVQASALRSIILRTALLYGAPPYFRRPNIFFLVYDALQHGRVLRMINDQYRTPTYAQDLAKICYSLAKKEITGLFHVAGKEILTPYGMAQCMASCFPSGRGEILPISTAEYETRTPRPLHSGLLIDKAVRCLGYTPTHCAGATRAIQMGLPSYCWL